ncbi:MAG: transposase [Pirellulales bacterium]
MAFCRSAWGAVLPARGVGGGPDAETPRAPRPRVGAISFLHRFGSGLNRHAHLHAAVTDGVFLPGSHGPDGLPASAFLAARPLTAADLATLTERVRHRVIGWFKRQGFLDAHAAAVNTRCLLLNP